MGDESGGAPGSGAEPRASLSPAEVRAFAPRAPRAPLSVAVRCVTTAAGQAVGGMVGESQAGGRDALLVNLSRSGMLVQAGAAIARGTAVDFELRLDDGAVALRGRAEVARVENLGENRGIDGTVAIGLQFVALDEPAQDLVVRLVDDGLSATNASGAEIGAADVSYEHGRVRVVLSPASARWFVRNPLLHIGLGGCFLPAPPLDDVALGTGYQLDVVADGRVVLRCKARVAAKQSGQIGLRFVDVDRPALQALRAEIARLTSRP